MAANTPTPPPPAPAPQRPTGAPRWLLPAAIGAVAGLLIGFTAGWFGFRAYLTASMNAAAEEIEAGLPDEMPLEEAEPVEEEEEDPSARRPPTPPTTGCSSTPPPGWSARPATTTPTAGRPTGPRGSSW
ncbi:hypothetical protein ACFQXA_03055 [Nocardiopsis composta]